MLIWKCDKGLVISPWFEWSVQERHGLGVYKIFMEFIYATNDLLKYVELTRMHFMAFSEFRQVSIDLAKYVEVSRIHFRVFRIVTNQLSKYVEATRIHVMKFRHVEKNVYQNIWKQPEYNSNWQMSHLVVFFWIVVFSMSAHLFLTSA